MWCIVPTIKPIPKNLLTDTIAYKPILSDQGDGWNSEYGEEQEISFVRVEPATSMNRSSDSQGRQANDIVFIDRNHSSFFPTDAKAGDLINDREVTRVKKLKTFDEIHHLEIEVV